MKLFYLFIFILLTGFETLAQERNYTVEGEMSRDSLRFTKQAIKKLYLNRFEDGERILIDSAEVKDKRFRFSGITPQEISLYSITGFDNGDIQFFVEPGRIQIAPFDAHFPVAAQVGGTPNNEVWRGFQRINAINISKGNERLNILKNNLPDSITNSLEAFQPYHRSVFHSNNLYYKTGIMKYLQQHLDSPVALYIIKFSIVPMFTPKVVERQYLRALPQSLHSHSMYKELVNQLRAASLKVGNPAPDIIGKTPDGKEMTLSDLKGKYVLLDFWASWCAPCRREFPFLKQAMAHSENYDNFVIMSYSIDNKEKDWLSAIEKNQLLHKNWIHLSDLKGWNSKAAKLFNVEAVPKTILLNPKGEVVAFDLRGEEMLNKVKRIMEGIEKYE